MYLALVPNLLSNVVQSLLNSEIDEVSSKIAALETIRNQLQQSLLRLHEEELELDEELESVMERLAFEARKGPSTPSKPSAGVKRRKGPAFLPSEHDDLPAGVAFMVRMHVDLWKHVLMES